MPQAPNICARVRASCRQWMEHGPGRDFVHIHSTALQTVADRIRVQQQKQQQQQQKQQNVGASSNTMIVWDEEQWHYQPPPVTGDAPLGLRRLCYERQALYILALDAINFCFWPTPGFEYEHLAMALTRMAEQDHLPKKNEEEEEASSILPSSLEQYVFSPARLSHMTVDEMTQLFVTHCQDSMVPNDMDARVALWNELGSGLMEHFHGSALELIGRAEGSAVQLVQLLVDHFPGFCDTVVYQHPTNDNDNKNATTSTTTKLYFLKRAQICVGDLQAALGDYGAWNDVAQLTTFADYRLPQLLRHWGVLEYVSDELRHAVDQCQTIPPGSAMEISIRAATVVTVEELVRLLQQQEREEGASSSTSLEEGAGEKASSWTDVQVDWYLWQVGEKMDAANELAPHHRVRTIYY